jgi:uncharacterized protein DUF6159
MFDRVANSWELMRQSWGVLRQDKQLVLFPILSAVVCLAVMATFAAPFLVEPQLVEQIFGKEQPGDPERQSLPQQVIFYSLLFVYYFVNYFIVVFFNTALVSCAIIRFRGETPTVGDGLRMAGARLPQIAAWAAVAATVGIVLKMIEDKSSAVGKFVVSLLGVAWSIVTYFVVPILAVERVGPFAAVQRSVRLLRKTWGEALVGGFSFGVINLLLSIPGILLIVAGFMTGAVTHSIILGVAIGALGLIYLIAVAIVISTLQQVFLAGVYVYAAEGCVPDGFSKSALKSAFRRKRE